jgi:hypothetical protein
MIVSINTRAEVETFGVASRKTANQHSRRPSATSVVLSGQWHWPSTLFGVFRNALEPVTLFTEVPKADVLRGDLPVLQGQET